MKKKHFSFLLSLMLAISFLLSCVNGINTQASNQFQSLNPTIEVGDKIYVQHAVVSENQLIPDVYELKKSGTGITTIFEVIIPEFTANKVWTRTGEYMDNVAKRDNGDFIAHSATAPDKYIPVTADEEYFLRTYGVGGVKISDTEFYYYAPVLFMDDNNQVVGDALYNMLSRSKNGVTITVPEGATRMHLTMYGNQSFTLQKVLNVTDEEFDALVMNQEALLDKINDTYEAYKKDPVLYQKPDKAYITFVNDDTRWQMDQYADLFIKKKVPLVLATVPEALIENASTQAETRLEVVRRVIEAGGEVLAHNGTPLTQEGFSDYGTMYSFFVRTKQLFNFYGFDVNGIILSGGTGQVVGAEESERWASSLFSYSDLYGVKYANTNLCMDSVFHHGRGGLVNYYNDVDKIKADIDKIIANKSWQVFYFHDSNDITLDSMSQVLDYVNSKSDTELEVVTYEEMYERFAEKESVIKNTNYTYYVSSTGTSSKGLSADDPMSFETAQNKTYLSGDTILFKRGDTFYGTFCPKIAVINDKKTTISAYGEGEMPTISGYKIADSESSWQLHSEGIYKVYLKDINSFSGLQTTDDNSCNIGFLEDENGVKYYNKSESLSMANEYDFYCDGNYIYMKCDENPYKKLGTLKMATKTNLLQISSNMYIKNIRVCGTGAHGILGCSTDTDQVVISNCIIEDIGGSYLKGTTRYGNGIEFYGTNVSNVVVKNNIIRNVYDVGFTIQGTTGSGKNVTVKNNAFINNSQDSEIWESASATGVSNYQFTENVSVNQGRGWGYEARPDKYVAGHILFWQYLIEGDTDINFHHNIVYNPRRLYFIEQTNGTNIYFKEKDYIKSDYNTYMLTEDAKLFRDSYSLNEKDTFIAEYKKDANSTFTLIEVDEAIINTASTSNDIKTVNKLFKEINEEDYLDDNDPVVPDDNDPVVPDDNDPVVPDDNNPVIPDDNNPVVPDDNNPVVPDDNDPVVPDDNNPVVPDDNNPIIPDDNNPGVSENSGPASSDLNEHTHITGDWCVEKDATTTTDGLKLKKCTICGTILEFEIIPQYTVSFNVKGTIPLQLKQSTRMIKAIATDGDQIVSYKSSNPKVASVTKNGKITGKKQGIAIITVTTQKGAKATIKIKVQKNVVKTKKLTTSKKKITLKERSSYKLIVTKTPITSLEKVTYSSSNKNVATVNRNGKIKAKSKGTAKITIRCGTKKATVKITVK